MRYKEHPVFIKDYYKNEEEWDKVLNDMCAAVLTGISKERIDTASNCICDRIWINITGGTNAVEMKLRDEKYVKYETMFIEEDKYNNLMGLWDKQQILPIYINCFKDHNFFYMWYLPAIPTPELTEKVIKDRLCGSKLVMRYLLPAKDAYKITFEGEILQKPKGWEKCTPTWHDVPRDTIITNKILREL